MTHMVVIFQIVHFEGTCFENSKFPINTNLFDVSEFENDASKHHSKIVFTSKLKVAFGSLLLLASE